jgi:hypothetical protein
MAGLTRRAIRTALQRAAEEAGKVLSQSQSTLMGTILLEAPSSQWPRVQDFAVWALSTIQASHLLPDNPVVLESPQVPNKHFLEITSQWLVEEAFNGVQAGHLHRQAGLAKLNKLEKLQEEGGTLYPVRQPAMVRQDAPTPSPASASASTSTDTLTSEGIPSLTGEREKSKKAKARAKAKLQKATS